MQNLFKSLRSSFLVALSALLIAGCSNRRVPVCDFGKYRANIFFGFGKSDITDESQANLKVIIATIKQYLESATRGKKRTVLIEIRGDASEEKTLKGKKANERIKKERANNTLNLLKGAIEEEGIIEGVEFAILSDADIVREDEPTDENVNGHKRAILNISFKQDRRTRPELLKKKVDVSDDAASTKKTRKCWFSRSKKACA